MDNMDCCIKHKIWDAFNFFPIFLLFFLTNEMNDIRYTLRGLEILEMEERMASARVSARALQNLAASTDVDLGGTVPVWAPLDIDAAVLTSVTDVSEVVLTSILFVSEADDGSKSPDAQEAATVLSLGFEPRRLVSRNGKHNPQGGLTEQEPLYIGKFQIGVYS